MDIVTNAALGWLVVERGDQVEQFAFRFQGLEAMGESFGDDEHLRVVWYQLLGVPLQECRRFRAQIHCDVPDPATHAPDHLHFRVRRMLEMQSSHSARMAGFGVIDLRDLAVAQYGPKFLGAEEPRERSARIVVRRRLHDLHIGDRSVEDVHAVAQLRPELAASAT